MAGPAGAATFQVNSTGDGADAAIDGSCDVGGGVCTLRAAIQEANFTVAADTINFNIGGGGPQTITLTGALPFISRPVTIDGTTQPLFAGSPIIELSAAACGGVAALDLRGGSSGSTIRGLVINRCAAGRAIRLLGTSNNVIAGNFLGTDVTGTAALANDTGVYIGGSATASNNNLVGGTALADRNLISGNTADGVQINGGTGGADGNRVEGNYIGVDVTGTLDRGNGGQGVGVFGANANTNNAIGGTVAGARNVISGNGNDGVLISGASTTGNRVEGNFIGTNAAGTGAIPNRRGIEVNSSASLNTIGGPPGFENVISGNTDFGVLIDAGPSNTVAGNYIGTDAAGAAALPNGIDGVLVTNGAANNVIGGTTAAARNVVSGNTRNGIQLTGAATGNQVRGNYVGTNAAGTAALGNVRDGVVIWQASNNTIGGTAAGAGNVIAGNQSGIYMGDATATGNVVQGNYIGTDVSGTAALQNITGVYLHSASTTLGGTSVSARNLISGNSYIGVWIDGSLGGSSNVIQGNFIGLSASATALPNARGVQVYNGSANNTIGGTVAGAGNTIAYNTNYGIAVLDTATGNAIESNAVHSNGGLGIDLNDDGVTANDQGDGDTGPNGRQNFAVLSGAATDGVGNVHVAGSLNSTVSAPFRVEFFASSAPDASGFGEGQRYLGFLNVATNILGDTVFGVTLPVLVTAGEVVTATVTNAANNTSEFSAYVTALGTLVVTTSADTVDGTVTSVAALIAAPGADGRISLREAIRATNNTAGTHTIRFGIPLTDANHFYYQNNGVAGTLTTQVATTLADAASPSAPAIPDFDPDYVGTPFSWFRIQPGSALPTITRRVTIDGYSQPGAQPNTVAAPGISNAILKIELDGQGNNFRGLDVNAASCAIRGLVVNRFGGVVGSNLPGILVQSAGAGSTIVGNYVGTDVTGTIRRANQDKGVWIQASADNTVGGTTPADRNLISGNRNAGLEILDAGSTGNLVVGNFIGTDVRGTAALGNWDITYGGDGVRFSGTAPSGNTIGGTTAAARNVISGNEGQGIAFWIGTGNLVQGNYIGTNVGGTAAVPNGLGAGWGGIGLDGNNNTIGGAAPGSGNLISGNVGPGLEVLKPGNVVQGNLFGTDAAGTSALANTTHGVLLSPGSSNVAIGGTAAGAGNTIAFNGGSGVRLAPAAGTGNAILGNKIRSNGELGIDLNADGVTPNDPLDADSGPNALLNQPAITAVSAVGGSLVVLFGLDVPAGSYRIEFFKNPSGPDPSGYGEGEVFAGSRNITHPGGGAIFFSHSFAGNAGDVITGTATACTDGAVCATFGSTSEFANATTAVTTAVKLMSFTAVAHDGAVDLLWQTASELDNLGFHLYRSLSASGPWTRLTPSLIPGLGSSPIGKSYSFRDAGLTNGVRYFYRLEDIDAWSRTTSHGPVSAVPTAAPESKDETSEKQNGKGKGKDSASCPDWVLAAYASASGANGSTASPACTRHGEPEAVSLVVLSRDSRSTALELRTGGFYALHEPTGGVRAFVPGFEFPSDQEAAALPFRRALVDAVVGRRVQLGGVSALDTVGFPGLVPSALGKSEMLVSWDGTVRPGRRALRALPAPRVATDLVKLLPSVFQGETKSAVVEISPLRFDAGRQQLVLAKRVRVRLLFTGRETGESGRASHGRRAPGPRKPVVTGEVLARLYTRSRGLQAVAFEQLFPGRRSGFTASELRLERQGQAVGFHLEPAFDSFGPGSRLFFHADVAAGSTDFSSETAWELLNARDGVQMPLASAVPGANAVLSASTGQASFETDRFYQPGLLEAPEPWLWEGLASGATRTVSFTLIGVAATASGIAELEVVLQGASESGHAIDHHVSVSLNGAPVGEAQFAAKRPYRMSLSVPLSLLREGTNELGLANVPDTGVSSFVFLDRFTVSHPQAASLAGGVFEGTWTQGGTVSVAGVAGSVALLDVTAGGAAVWLTGHEATGSSLRFRAEAGRRYLAVSETALLTPRVVAPAASTLRSAANQADYLLIAPRAFLAAAEPLLERRRDQGLLARAVAFEEIADEFGHGQPSAEAIKSFLALVFHSWTQPSPRYALLLGDSSYDPRNFTGAAQPSPLPALWTKTSYLWTVSDPELAAVNGEDSLPDLAIGRLPATTVEQARLLVAKLVAWEDSGQGLAGPAALVADNPDLAGDFEADVQDIARSFLAERNPQVLRLRELGAGTRPAIRDALNSGLSLLSYVGHGGAAVWASENVWNSWDAPSLQAQSQQPLLLTLNCLNGYFVAPAFDSLTESLLKAEGRGAIAGFSPSGLSLDGPAHQYHRALMAELTSGRHERLGDALTAAQKTYAQTGLMPELLIVYQLLGDPAMRIQ